ncbi:cation-binding protein [Sphaerisporangium siamense]|uniref:Deazaflavin-dependent oxidoreductase (Nitroreductase family) n=1 Tax=Sphaerisporangium siamense TaxID=795645 RepID=A0A7W7DBS4_9ACTN|nr:nitroreductase/quinone reductase family protein [Sphaerisporangium siamense]MBB4703920.1 deazaflavin-dependent oxidoreductase (nitroreductase family) [Sphaerisporangium siamense]GII82391.1 cation-binding protein [Sphaerisporangium siamense]
MPIDFNQQVIEEFRATKGQVGGPFAGGRLLLLTTTGARSGRPHTTPLAYLPDGLERTLVVASAGGSPRHPDWFRNVLANPEVTVEFGLFTVKARAAVLEGEERDRLFARAAEADPAWADYEAKSGRTLPVVALYQIMAGPPAAGSFGATLKLVHQIFRRELALIRQDVARSGPALGAQLRVNCLTVCQGLHHHHVGEDTMLFPRIGERHPHLAPVLERLNREHEAIAALMEELKAVLSAGDADPARLAHQVERLTTELETHLDYEEEHLVPLLDAPAP